MMLSLVVQVRQGGIDFFVELVNLIAKVSSPTELISSVLLCCGVYIYMYIRINSHVTDSST